MHVKSAYSTSGSSYISPSSYRYRSSLSDRTSYTNSSTTSSNIYRRSFRYDLPSSSSAYSSYRSDRAADTDLSTSLSALSTKDSAVSSGSTPSTTVNSKDTFSRPSRYSTAYSYSSSSQVPARDYSSSRITSRSSDTRPKDRDNNYLCTGGAGSSSSYISNLRSTALSGAEIYQKYSISTYKPNSFESRIAATRTQPDTSTAALDVSKEPVAQATIKLRSSLNGTSNGGTGYGSRCIATASATTDDIAEFDYHNVTATIRIKPKSSINHSTSSSSSSSTTSINNINNNANDGDSNNSSSDEHETSNGIVRNNNNCLDNGVNDGGGEDVDEVPSPAATVTINSADKEPKAFDDDKKVSYLRAGTASKSIHSTSPVGYRSRECDSGLSSYRSGLGIAAPSLAVQKSSYNDRTNGEESSETLARGGSRKEGTLSVASTQSIQSDHVPPHTGLCGLYNIGNTCFMNSVIQCLSHTRELTNFLRTQSAVERGTVKDHKILAEYIKLIKDMWNGINRSVNPSELKYAFSSKHRMYSGSAQQDAQEFLRFFIDSLHSALNVSIKREPISSAIEDDDLNNRIKADMMWEWYSKVENSVIKDLFVGLLRSTLKCTVCNGCSVTFDPFWDLSLPLPSTNSRCKLENCLDMFVKEEVMDGIDQPTCSRCKTRRKCTKSLTIERFPKYLVIHLKRFSETRWSKLTNVIEFPTGERELNLQPYASEDNTGPVYYSLYGISNHMGSTAGGHYVAVCKHPVSKEWHEFNDNFVSDASERSLVTSSAYVLFYERA
ncbi:ubiquitin carboxyl-terminal hydrolase Usp2 isoform X3 [Topomyia yanbarensis]|uniref:ubiquitin carboxyl-terminal hydrolase Usp2 isoform X3 n=1 Tax=Topomyia yanbarensis TaxID=2498891 RepID=UPI00273C9308|nr:ubiquitin carboxyl-terminal hydrolase Usp2 isoform X3 [Topomyia yanbarensis]